jgi:hypothetical protein
VEPVTKYRIGIVRTATEWVEVEAPNEAAAKARADENSAASLCCHCAEHLELEDVIEYVVDK